MRAAFLPILLLLAMLMTTGCWDRQEINDLTIIMATGVDAVEEDKVQLTGQFTLPFGGSGAAASSPSSGQQTEAFSTVSAQGKNINDVIQRLQSKLSRKLFVAHRRVLIIGEPLAKRGLQDILDHFSRQTQSRLKTYVVIAKNSPAADLLNSQVLFEQIPGEEIRDLVRSVGVKRNLGELVTAMSSIGVVPTVGAIQLVPSSAHSKTSAFQMSGTAVIKDYKLVGYLNASQTRGLLWATNKLEQGSVITEVEDLGNVSLTIRKANRTITTTIRNDQVEAHIQVQAAGPIHENNTNLDLSHPQNIQIIKEALSKEITQNIENVINYAQKELNSDIFGIGEEVHRKHAKQWRTHLKQDWPELFPEIIMTVKVDVTITNAGQYGAPLHLMEEKLEKKE